LKDCWAGLATPSKAVLQSQALLFTAKRTPTTAGCQKQEEQRKKKKASEA
jgi:hypothetical protein